MTIAPTIEPSRPATTFSRAPLVHKLLGSLLEFRADQIGTLERMSRLGSPVSFRILNQHLHLVTDPAHIEHVLIGGARHYGKQTVGYWNLKKILGNGLLTSDGEFWRRQRRIAQPAFHRPRIEGLGAIMAQAAAEMVDGWRDGQIIELVREMMRVTLRVAGQCLLSRDISAAADEFGEAIAYGLTYVNYVKETPWAPPEWVPTPRNLRFRAAVRTLDRVIGGIIATRRRHADEFDDLLATLLRAKDPETGEQMSDAQLRDEIMTIIVAGHETTGSALTFTFDLLARHPEIEARLRAEVREVVGDRQPEIADLAKLPFNEQVILESMRLYPPAWMFARSVEADDAIGGYPVARGDWILLSPWVTQRRADLWPDPLRFDPERFAPQHAAGRHRYAYFPFAGGQRKCIGDRFALTEARLVLATVVQRAKLEALTSSPPVPDPQVTLRPRGDLPMRVTRL
jgi:cytochrome P450